MLTSLRTRGFRNLVDQTWRPAAGVNLIFGPNGAGKSSLLEAIYLAGTTRSFRTSRLAECARLGGREFFVSAETEGEERARLEVSWGPDGKRRVVNGETVPIAEHLAVLPLVSWTSRDGEIFEGPPARRRQMMDKGIISEHPATLSCLSDFRRALDAKRAALESQTSVLEEWNRVMARTGSELSTRRAAWIERLESALGSVLERSELDLGRVQLRYRPSPKAAIEGEEALFEALQGLKTAEIRRGRVLAGPQRDDLEILWRHGPVGRMASAGERKLMGLALMVARSELVAERGVNALCLIDDVDAELDRNSVDKIWKLLGTARQLVAATSRKSVVSRLEAAAEWNLLDGMVSNPGDDAKKVL